MGAGARARVLIADGLSAAGRRLLEGSFEVADGSGAGPEEVLAMLPSFDAAVVRSRTRVGAAALARPGRLRLIVRAGVGLDNIDASAAKAAGVEVRNTPGATTRSVAEHALALMFALARDIPRADASTKAGRWEKKALEGVELEGKTLSLAGFGRIGQELARMALGVGMRALAHDKLEELVRPAADAMGVALVPKDELLRRADFLSLHMPQADDTAGWLGARELALMRPTSYVVNTSRGSAVDEAALVAALEAGSIAGAALDVFSKEPVSGPLLKAPRVILTPHVAGSTREGQERAGEEAARIVLDFLGRSRP